MLVVIIEPFTDEVIQTPPLRRAMSKYGYEYIAKQTRLYLREPFVDLLGTGLCSSLGGFGPLIRLFAQVDVVMARAFLNHGVHRAVIQRVWKVLRENTSDNEVIHAFHESLASIT